MSNAPRVQADSLWLPRDYSALLAKLSEDASEEIARASSSSSRVDPVPHHVTFTTVSTILFTQVDPDQRASTLFRRPRQHNLSRNRVRHRRASHNASGVAFTSTRCPRQPPVMSGFIFGHGPQTCSTTPPQSWKFKMHTPITKAGYTFGSGLLTTSRLTGAAVPQSSPTSSVDRPQFPFKSYQDGFFFALTGKIPSTTHTEWTSSTRAVVVESVKRQLSPVWSLALSNDCPYMCRDLQKRLEAHLDYTPQQPNPKSSYSPREVERKWRQAKEAETRSQGDGESATRGVLDAERWPIVFY